MSRDLIVFAEDWGGLPSSTQHLIRQLAGQRRILWVNSIGLRRPRFTIRDLRRLWQKLTTSARSAEATPMPSGPGFHIVNPRTLPAPRSRLGRWLARTLLLWQLRPLLRRLQFQQPLLWLSLPTAVDLAGHLDEAAVIYYCGDDFGALAGVDHQLVCQRERELLQRADLILAASSELARRFPPRITRLLPHGVDLALFSAPAPRAADLPDDGRPIAGFYGSISHWFDSRLLLSAARRLPHWHFVLIGDACIDIAPLQRQANIHWLGPRPHRELPRYSQHWQASLLPFVDNAQIRACNPLKLREYLAAGPPVVSCPFPALAPYRHWIIPAHTPDALVSALRRLDNTGHRQATNESHRAVIHESWAARARQLDSWLESLC